jgi:hypothetical protein
VVSQGGFFANLALLSWPVVTIILFFVMKPEKAALVAIFGGLLFLPEVTFFKVPLMPPLNKQNIPYLSVLLAYSIRRPGRVWKLPREGWVTAVTAVLILSGIGIALTNPDGMIVGTWKKNYVPGLDVKDGMYIAIDSLFAVGVPFFLGGVVVRSREDLEDLLRFIVKLGLIYSLGALIELRMSPQLHIWFYGFHQHEFLQSVRFGGYRPTIFMAHGLAVGMFFCVSVLSAAVLRGITTEPIFRIKPKRVLIYLAIILIACKSTGAIIYAVVCVPLLLAGKPKVLQRTATVLAVIVMLYPSMRGSGIFPTDSVLSLAEMFGSEREDSVAFRFKNEDLLAKKARQRPVFGWGSYGRNFVYGGNGRSDTVTDGQWIIVIGSAGFVGFFTWFGMLVTPIFLAGRRLRRITAPADRRMVASVSLIVAVTALDLLPNSLFSNYPFFLSGALLSVSWALAYAPSSAYPARAMTPALA